MGFIDSYIKVSDTAEARTNLEAFGSKFGVELEILSPIPMGELQTLLIARLGSDAVRSSLGGYGTNDYARWSITSDSSIRVTPSTPKPPQGCCWNSIELISPAFDTAGTVCEAHLRSVFDLLRELGAVTNESCGLHISSSCSGISSNNFKPFVFCALADDMTLLRRFDRIGNRYCAPTSPKAMALVSFKAARRRPSTTTHPHVGTHAAHAALSVPSRNLSSISGKYHSVNVGKLSKSNQASRIVEYRGIGGDYLSIMSSDQLVGIARRLGVAVLHAVHSEVDPTLGSLVSRYYAKVSSKLPTAAKAKARRGVVVAERDLGSIGILQLHCGVSVRNNTETLSFKFVLVNDTSPFDRYRSPLRTLTSRDMLRESWMQAPSADIQHAANSLLSSFFSTPSVQALKPLFCKPRSTDIPCLRKMATNVLAFKSANAGYLEKIRAVANRNNLLPTDLTKYEASVEVMRLHKGLTLGRGHVNPYLLGHHPSLSRALSGHSVIMIRDMCTATAGCHNMHVFMLYWLISYVRSGASVADFDFSSFIAYITGEAPSRLMRDIATCNGNPSPSILPRAHREIVSDLIRQHNLLFDGQVMPISSSDISGVVCIAHYSVDGLIHQHDDSVFAKISDILSKAKNQLLLLNSYVDAITTSCTWCLDDVDGRGFIGPARNIQASPLGAAIYKLAILNTSAPS